MGMLIVRRRLAQAEKPEKPEAKPEKAEPKKKAAKKEQ